MSYWQKLLHSARFKSQPILYLFVLGSVSCLLACNLSRLASQTVLTNTPPQPTETPPVLSKILFWQHSMAPADDFLYEMAPDGSHIKLLIKASSIQNYPSEAMPRGMPAGAPLPLSIGSPTWDPNSQNIAFLVWPTGGSIGVIYRMKADGSNAVPLSTQPVSGDIAWSPDGAHIAWATRQGIFTISVDGSTVVNLSSHLNNLAMFNYLSWSPDSKRLVFSADGAHPNLYIINADGTQITQITNNIVEAGTPTWAPDGGLIAFAARNAQNAQNIYVTNPNGTHLVQITNNTDTATQVTEPSWSPDSQQIAYASGKGDTFGIYIMNANGTNVRLVQSNGQLPVWSSER